jgi:hypothetical protein
MQFTSVLCCSCLQDAKSSEATVELDDLRALPAAALARVLDWLVPVVGFLCVPLQQAEGAASEVR